MGGGGGGNKACDRETKFSQLAKRSASQQFDFYYSLGFRDFYESG